MYTNQMGDLVAVHEKAKAVTGCKINYREWQGDPVIIVPEGGTLQDVTITVNEDGTVSIGANVEESNCLCCQTQFVSRGNEKYCSGCQE